MNQNLLAGGHSEISSEEAAVKTLGNKLRARRMELSITIEELAAKADVSPGSISQIERGIGNPSFMTLARIAYALDLSVGRLFEGPDSPSQVVRHNERKRLEVSDREVTFELLTPDLQRDLEMVWVEYAPGISTKERPYQHNGEECGLVLQGHLIVHVGESVYELEPGDSIWIDCTVPHWYENKGEERVLSVWAITPPSF